MNTYYPILGIKCPNCNEHGVMSDGIDSVYCSQCGNEEFTEDDFKEIEDTFQEFED